jgi:hypothetical protein
MKMISRNIRDFPFHLFILPLPFILKTINQYPGLIGFEAAAIAFFKVLIVLTLSFLILYAVIKDRQKAGVIITVSGIIFLFFGNIKESFRHIPWLDIFTHYRYYLPLIFLLSAFIIYKTAKAKKLSRVNSYLNILILVYLLIETWNFTRIQKEIKTSTRKLITKHTDPQTQVNVHSLPNIYYMLFDCYPSSSFQKEMLGADNSYFDSILRAKGFYIATNSSSNYNRTSFSMAATLNMDYLEWLNPSGETSVIDYNRSLYLVKHAASIELLKKNGYHLYNFSIFDIDDKPSIKKENFLTGPIDQVIFYNTAWNCLLRDISLQIKPGPGNTSRNAKLNMLERKYGPQKKYNQQVLDTITSVINTENKNSPFFLYAHLYLPHFPYFFDSSGRPYPEDSLYNDSLITDRKKFTGYISYTNQKILSLVEHLFQRPGGSDIVIIQSDHGLADMDFTRKKDAFRNYFAVYFPDHDYRLLYDSISNINTFRVILNKYLNYKFPSLKDHSVYLKN